MLIACGCTPRLQIRDAGKGTRYDPTGTFQIRRKFEAALVRRFTVFRKAIYDAVVRLDVLGLSGKIDPHGAMLAHVFGQTTRDAQPPKGAFAFTSSSRKVSAFMDWLGQMQRDGILEVSTGTSLSTAAENAWQNTYIDSAYRKGLRDSYDKAGFSGDVSGAFNRAVHADAVGMAYTRTYRDLEGVTDAMDLSISRSLAESIAQGYGAVKTARELVDDVDSIGIVRARTLARTETIRAYSQASLNGYREAGIEGVNVKVEFTTSQDNAVCEDCEDLEGKIFSLDDADGMIPVHPNCRCAFEPVIEEDDKSDSGDDEESD